MPIYAVGCPECGREDTIFRRVDERDRDLPECCGATMERLITAPAIQADIPAYQSQITGEMIEGRAAHRAHLRQHNCREVGNDIQPMIEKTMKREMYVPPDSAYRRKKLVADLVDQKLRG